jgi:hypothetical protein
MYIIITKEKKNTISIQTAIRSIPEVKQCEIISSGTTRKRPLSMFALIEKGQSTRTI